MINIVMADIKFEVAKKIDESILEIKRFKEVFSKASANTVFQIRHFNLIDRGLYLYDYIMNDDITPTTIEKIKELRQDIEYFLNSSDFKELEDDSIELSEIISKRK